MGLAKRDKIGGESFDESGERDGHQRRRPNVCHGRCASCEVLVFGVVVGSRKWSDASSQSFIIFFIFCFYN